MKIFQVNASYKPAYIYGGPTMSVSKLSEELTKAGENVEVLTTSANGVAELNVKVGIKTIVNGVPVTYFRRITKDNSHLSPPLLLSLWNILRKKKFSNNNSHSSADICSSDVVHIHAWWNLVSVGSCVIALLAAKPIILSPRGTLSNYSFGNRNSFLKNIFHNVLGKALLGYCHFHVSTEKEKLDIINIITPKSITVIPNFVNLGEHVKEYNSSDNNIHTVSTEINLDSQTFKLLFLSRIEEKKGLDILFRSLNKVNFKFHLTIAGSGHPGYISYLKLLISELNLRERVTWIGQQHNNEKFKVLAAHDLMILPSHDESFANVVIESLSVGTPVLISKKVGLADYVLENRFGWVYNEEDELGQVLNKACADLKCQQFTNERGPKQIRIDFEEKKLINKYIQMYRRASYLSHENP